MKLSSHVLLINLTSAEYSKECKRNFIHYVPIFGTRKGILLLAEKKSYGEGTIEFISDEVIKYAFRIFIF